MLLLSIVIFAAAVYTIFKYFRNTPTITLTETQILFNNSGYSLDSITHLVFTGKQSFSYIGSPKMEAIAITFSDLETRYIFDDMYSNLWQIKLILKQRIIDKIESPTLPLQHNDTHFITDTDFFDTYKGSLAFSLRGISLFTIIILALGGMLSKPIPEILLTMTFLIIFWTYVHAQLLYFFDVSEKFLVIKNYIFFWRKKVFRITDIKEVVYETQGRMPYCLRVITKDYKSKLYPAGTLNNPDWKSLKSQLESYNIIVRDECIY
ncbi:MAG: hypothetical protein ACK4S0_11730 [Sediminibacterium sp.]